MEKTCDQPEFCFMANIPQPQPKNSNFWYIPDTFKLSICCSKSIIYLYSQYSEANRGSAAGLEYHPVAAEAADVLMSG